MQRSLLILASGLAAASAQAVGLTDMRLTLLDAEATGYATFQSHNQKVVANAHGIFTTHIRSRNEAFTAQQWRLSRSRDGGATFETLYESVDATNAPAMETDAVGNLYLVRSDFSDGSASLYRFQADDYAQPTVTRIPGGSAGKYCMNLDEARSQFYYFTWGRSLFVLGLDGAVLERQELTVDGANALPQYPLSFLDPSGVLHFAWTTQKHGVYLYWDIHYMASDDGAQSWRRMDGTPLSIPLPTDDSGTSDRITLDDEFEVHSWLSNLLVKDGKAHFAYAALTPTWRQHYVRYDLATATRDVDLHPIFEGEEIRLASLDGFFASRIRSGGGPPLLRVERRGTLRMPSQRRQRRDLVRLRSVRGELQSLLHRRVPRTDRRRRDRRHLHRLSGDGGPRPLSGPLLPHPSWPVAGSARY